MVALTTAGTTVFVIFGASHRRIAAHFSRKSQEMPALAVPVPLLQISRQSLGLPNGRKGRGRVGEVCAEEEPSGSYDLEAEIFEFMEKSANPKDFPRREDLIAAGREDLAKAIAKEGGWLAYGWDLDSEEQGDDSAGSVLASKDLSENDSRTFSRRIDSDTVKPGTCLNADMDDRAVHLGVSSGASSSGWPMDTEALEDAGIDGILYRLEKERSLAFDFVSRKENDGKSEKGGRLYRKAEELDSGDTGRHLKRFKCLIKTVGSIEYNGRLMLSDLEEGSLQHVRSNFHHPSSIDVDRMTLEPATWRAWSNHRSGNPLSNFEAAEILCDEDQQQYGPNSVSNHLIENKMNRLAEVQNKTGDSASHFPCDNDQGNVKNQISEHLQHLESQLTSALDLLRSRTNKVVSYKGEDQESLVKELHKLSDALEFQQNEIKNARDLLRSTRAKLAVMDGKIALEVIESQKKNEEEQRRFNAAERAIFVLRSVCIVWPNSASEVLLVGSFDGWTSQRRMEKSNASTFALNLKLYPGRYEIKFIVDGIWTVDQLRPIVKNNGFENNLLIVT